MNIAIFSYNRGQHLAHCVATAEQAAPHCPLTVYDDDSEDPYTRQVLADVGQRHRVVVTRSRSVDKHGGLYANMQRALIEQPEDQPLLFLQDDMQLVRTIDANDHAAINDYFAQPTAAFLSPAFIQTAHGRKGHDDFERDASSGQLLPRESGQSAGVYYSDLSICLPARLLAVHWQFAHRERANEQQAKRHFARMATLFTPFVMWLPLVPSYRGKRKTWALAYAERNRRCGFYPFAMLDSAAVSQLRRRGPTVFPYAEDCLRLKCGDLPRPWTYNALQGQRLFKNLNKWEQAIRKVLDRIRNTLTSVRQP